MRLLVLLACAAACAANNVPTTQVAVSVSGSFPSWAFTFDGQAGDVQIDPAGSTVFNIAPSVAAGNHVFAISASPAYDGTQLPYTGPGVLYTCGNTQCSPDNGADLTSVTISGPDVPDTLYYFCDVHDRAPFAMHGTITKRPAPPPEGPPTPPPPEPPAPLPPPPEPAVPPAPIMSATSLPPVGPRWGSLLLFSSVPDASSSTFFSFF